MSAFVHFFPLCCDVKGLRFRKSRLLWTKFVTGIAYKCLFFEEVGGKFVGIFYQSSTIASDIKDDSVRIGEVVKYEVHIPGDC